MDQPVQVVHPRVSIIVPIHNSEKYLEQCLDSLVGQTMPDIEIICVDDGSTDGSREILKRYAVYSDKIRCIFYDEPRSASQARKDAVLSSVGDFILFVDSDDYLESKACITAYNAIRRYQTDILQFGTVIENCANLPEARIKSNQVYLAPCLGGSSVKGDLLVECFINREFSFTLWNKMYYGEVCRRAFAKVSDGFFPKANDLYAAYYILSEAKSYSGISVQLYHYCFGRGMTGHDQLSMHDFELCCASSKVYKAIKAHAEAFPRQVHIPEIETDNKTVENSGKSESSDIQPEVDESPAVIYTEQDVIQNIRERFHIEQLSKWNNNIPVFDKREALDIYCNAWDQDPFEVICGLSRSFAYNKTIVSKYLDVILKPREERHKIKNIAIYYRNIFNGGAQRVVAYLASYFADLDDGKAFNVLLLTDSEPTEDDYDISPRITRVVLPMFEPAKKNYEQRGKVLLDVIDKYNIDAFIHSVWNGPSFFWDMLSIRTSKRCPAFFSHMHSYFGVPWRQKSNEIEEMYNSYAYLDGLVTLSDCDRYFWKYCNSNIYTIANPCMEKEPHPRNQWHEGPYTVLWVGRISGEKQPFDVVRIMKYVIDSRPDAICRILGDGENQKLTDSLVSLICSYGLEENIILEGFHKDVDRFYEDADVLISTSSIEGFPLTIMEAASYGIPTVLYDLPWLEYFKIIQGWEKVGQNRSKEAAEKILEILSDQKEWEKRSKSLYSSYQKFRSCDNTSQWLKVFENYEKGISPEEITDRSQEVIYRQLMSSHGVALGKYAEAVEEKNEIVRQKNTRIKQLDNIISNYVNKTKDMESVVHNLETNVSVLQTKLEAAAAEYAETIEKHDITLCQKDTLIQDLKDNVRKLENDNVAAMAKYAETIVDKNELLLQKDTIIQDLKDNARKLENDNIAAMAKYAETIGDKNELLLQKEAKIIKLENNLKELDDDLKNLQIELTTSLKNAKQNEKRCKSKEAELDAVYHSASWKLGSTIMSPFHWIKTHLAK